MRASSSLSPPRASICPPARWVLRGGGFSNKFNVAVVVDSSTREISEFTSAARADIKDLFEVDFYLDLVNQACASVLPAPITDANLSPYDPRIVRQIETYFRDNGIGGKINHFDPAAVLLRQQPTQIPKLSASTLDRSELLFKRLNEMIK